MSKGLKKVIGVAAAIAIPFAAPAIVGSIAASGALGATVTGALGTTAGFTAGSALTGAALGAGTAALTGQNVGRGALFGGLGGGIGGYMQGADLAAQQAAQLQNAGVSTNSLAGVGGTAASGYTGAAPVPLATSTAPGGGVLKAGLQGTDAASRAAQAAASGAGTAATAPTTFAETLKRVPAAIANRFRDPEAIADMTLRAGGMLAGSAAAGSGLSPAEEQLLQAQTAELEWLRQNNQAAFQQRLQAAQQLLGQAKYFDPEYFGMQSARRQQIAGSIAEREGLRGLTGAAREAEQRRYRLGTARNVGTAYDTGFGQGVQARTQLTQAGLQALPSPNQYSTMGGFGTLFSAYGQGERRRERTLDDMGSLFGSFRPQDREEETVIGGGP